MHFLAVKILVVKNYTLFYNVLAQNYTAKKQNLVPNMNATLQRQHLQNMISALIKCFKLTMAKQHNMGIRKELFSVFSRFWYPHHETRIPHKTFYKRHTAITEKSVSEVTLNARPKFLDVCLDGFIDNVISSIVLSFVRAKKLRR